MKFKGKSQHSNKTYGGLYNMLIVDKLKGNLYTRIKKSYD